MCLLNSFAWIPDKHHTLKLPQIELNSFPNPSLHLHSFSSFAPVILIVILKTLHCIVWGNWEKM